MASKIDKKGKVTYVSVDKKEKDPVGVARQLILDGDLSDRVVVDLSGFKQGRFNGHEPKELIDHLDGQRSYAIGLPDKLIGSWGAYARDRTHGDWRHPERIYVGNKTVTLGHARSWRKS